MWNTNVKVSKSGFQHQNNVWNRSFKFLKGMLINFYSVCSFGMVAEHVKATLLCIPGHSCLQVFGDNLRFSDIILIIILHIVVLKILQ